jgi:hypothetical protein
LERLGRLGALTANDTLTDLSDLPPHKRMLRYLDLAAEARREAARSPDAARQSYLFLAEQWERLAAYTAERYGLKQPKNSDQLDG